MRSKTWLWIWRQPARLLRRPLQTKCRSSPRPLPLLRVRRKAEAARPSAIGWLARPSALRPLLPPPPPSPPSSPPRWSPLQPMLVPSKPSPRQRPRVRLWLKPPRSKSRPPPARPETSLRSSRQRAPRLHLRSKAAARRAPSPCQKRTSLLPRSLLPKRTSLLPRSLPPRSLPPRRASTSFAVGWAREAARRSRRSPRHQVTPRRHPARTTQTRWMSTAR